MKSLQTIGGNIEIAIKRRELTRKDVAELAGMSLPTLRAIISGSKSVGIGKYEDVLIALDLQEHLYDVASPERDAIGQEYSLSKLPQRVSKKRNKW